MIHYVHGHSLYKSKYMNIHLVFDYQNCHRYCVKRAKCQIIPRLQMSEQTSKQVSNWILTSSNFVIPFQNCSYVNPFSSQINEISSINKYAVHDRCSVIRVFWSCLVKIQRSFLKTFRVFWSCPVKNQRSFFNLWCVLTLSC